MISLPGANTHLTFAAPFTSPSAIRIELKDFGDLGLDNLSFSQSTSTAPIPEPHAVAAFSVGLAVVGWGIARSRRSEETAGPSS